VALRLISPTTIFMTPLTLLIAEDEEEIRLLLAQWLTPMGHTVHSARNGVEALKLIDGIPFDLVITDILMPDGDGLTVIKGLKRLQPKARVLAISGGGRYMDSKEYLKIAEGFGADAAIMKPFNRDQFLQAISRAMEHGVTELPRPKFSE
jgi:two-component system, chemotaxis family, chemotaxis protein CheY